MSTLRLAAPLSLSVVFVVLLAPAAAAGAIEPAPVGYWEVRDTEGILMLLLSVDGSGYLNRQGLSWTYAGGVLTLVQADKTVSYDAKFDPDTLSLSGGDLRHPIRMRFTMGGKKYDDAIVGTWSAVGGETIELGAGGVGSTRRGPFRFTAMDGYLAYADPSITFTSQYKVDGDHLTLTTATGSVTLTRGAAPQDASARGPRPANAKPRVVVNGKPLDGARLETLARDPKLRFLDGSYWYDRKCGAWGIAGGPALGYVPAELDLGGPLAANASTGGTGVFLNGREIPPAELDKLKEAVGLEPGRYWLEAKGAVGYEGNGTQFTNLYAKAAEAWFVGGGRYRDPADITGIRRQESRPSFVMGSFERILLGD